MTNKENTLGLTPLAVLTRKLAARQVDIVDTAGKTITKSCISGGHAVFAYTDGTFTHLQSDRISETEFGKQDIVDFLFTGYDYTTDVMLSCFLRTGVLDRVQVLAILNEVKATEARVKCAQLVEQAKCDVERDKALGSNESPVRLKYREIKQA